MKITLINGKRGGKQDEATDEKARKNPNLSIYNPERLGFLFMLLMF